MMLFLSAAFNDAPASFSESLQLASVDFKMPSVACRSSNRKRHAQPSVTTKDGGHVVSEAQIKGMVSLGCPLELLSIGPSQAMTGLQLQLDACGLHVFNRGLVLEKKRG